MFGFGWGESVAAKHRAEREAEQDRKAALPQVHVPVKTLLEESLDRANALVNAMTARKLRLENEIREREEELRQTNIVLAGGNALVAHVQEGFKDLPAPDPTKILVEGGGDFDALLEAALNQSLNPTSNPV